MKLFKRKDSSKEGRSRQSSRSSSLSTQQYYKAEPNLQPAQSSSTGWFLPVVIFCLLMAFSYNLIVSPSANINLNSEAYRPKSEYQSVVDAKLSSFLNRNKLTLASGDIETELKQAFPEVQSISLSLPLIGKKPSIHITVAKPTLYLTSANQNYIVDSQGRAVVKNTTANNSNLTEVNDKSGFSINLGQQVLATDEVSFINYLSEQAKKRGLKVKEFVLPPGSPSETYMYLTDTNYYVKFFLGGQADVQLGSYLALMGNLSEQGLSPTSYIDVRVEEKAFVR